MYIDALFTALFIIGLTSMLFYGCYQISRYAFALNSIVLCILAYFLLQWNDLVLVVLRSAHYY